MKNVSFVRNGKEFEPTKDELKRVLDDYAERLAIAEAKLAESETENKRLNYVVHKHKKQSLEMAQQLAEKEKKYNQIHKFNKETNDKLEKQVREQFNLIDQLTQNADNQIAISELNSLKIIIERKNNKIKKGHYSEIYKDGYSVSCCDIEDVIDFCIKELRGEKNGNFKCSMV